MYYPKGNLQILPSPHLHPVVVGTNVIKIVPVNGKQSTGNSWRPIHINYPWHTVFSSIIITRKNLIGSVRSLFRRFSSRSGAVYHRKFMCQLKPP